jgi:hypothetical protein
MIGSFWRVTGFLAAWGFWRGFLAGVFGGLWAWFGHGIGLEHMVKIYHSILSHFLGSNFNCFVFKIHSHAKSCKGQIYPLRMS